MIAFLTICYCGILWLLFFKLKLLPWNRNSQIAAAGIGIFAILALVIAMNLFQPYSQDVRVYQRVIQIVPRVTGRVIEVPIRANEPLKAGDVLFRISPDPFQFAVDRLEADLELKKIILDDAKALTSAGAAAQIKRDRAQAAYDQTLAMFNDAQVDLRETTVYAPTDGIVTNLALRPGQIASQMASLPLMTFLETETRTIIATFSQSALEFVHTGGSRRSFRPPVRGSCHRAERSWNGPRARYPGASGWRWNSATSAISRFRPERPASQPSTPTARRQSGSSARWSFE
ncbi:MAG: HlyD family secretion protein [Deltaproteobacteria bacterium]|nr:HlyD family secretion protein [Deltaproteobacteria bacterium]